MIKIVNIDGKEFNLDVIAAQKSGVLVPVEPISIGQYYEKIDNGEKYILAAVAFNEVCLISLADGNRYMESIHVDSIRNITLEEFKMICGDEIFDRVYSFRVGTQKKKKN